MFFETTNLKADYDMLLSVIVFNDRGRSRL